MRSRIVIIGAGVIGASVAWHLSRRGARDILILDREAEQGKGSTGKATGGVRAQFGTAVNIKMSLYSLDFFSNCEFECGYEPRGYLFLATEREQLDLLRRGAQLQRSLGYDGVEIVEREAIRSMVPALNCEDIVGGSFGPRDGFIDPIAVMRGFTLGALAHGARIAFETNVKAINTSHGRVRSVSTDRGDIECETAVLCTGAWSSRLAATAGVELPVEPLRRQIVWSRTAEPLPPSLPMVIELGNGFHFRPARDFVPGTYGERPPSDGRDLIFAYPETEETYSFSTQFEPAFVDKVYERARHRVPSLADSMVVAEKCRAGLYENTPDHHAIIGACDIDGLYLANGFSGHGVMHSPATGRAISDILIDGHSAVVDIDSLGIGRFDRGELIEGAAFI